MTVSIQWVSKGFSQWGETWLLSYVDSDLETFTTFGLWNWNFLFSMQVLQVFVSVIDVSYMVLLFLCECESQISLWCNKSTVML